MRGDVQARVEGCGSGVGGGSRAEECGGCADRGVARVGGVCGGARGVLGVVDAGGAAWVRERGVE